jgi:hypothetical protein
MKRAPELRDLSDHHHRGLVQARRLRMAATGDGANLHEEIGRGLPRVLVLQILTK